MRAEESDLESQIRQREAMAISGNGLRASPVDAGGANGEQLRAPARFSASLTRKMSILR